jgi:hypothetical protein
MRHDAFDHALHGPRIAPSSRLVAKLLYFATIATFMSS